MKYVSGFIWKLGINFSVCIKWIDETWWNNRLLLVPNCYEVVAMVATMVAMVAPLWCHTEINKAVSQWLLTFNLCVSVTWSLTCAFHIPCTHTPEIIDMHRGVCDKCIKHIDLVKSWYVRMTSFYVMAFGTMLLGVLTTMSMQCLFYMICMFSNKNSKPCCPLIGRACECWEFNTENALKMLTWWCLNMEEWSHFQAAAYDLYNT